MRFLLFTLCILSAAYTSAQNNWQLNEVGFGIGSQNDRIQNMSMDWMRMYARTEEAFDVELNGYDYTPYSEFIGTVLAFDVSFRKGETSPISHELRIGAKWITGREAMISYNRESEMNEGNYYESMIFCLVDDELAFDVTYLLRKTGKHFSMYTGWGGVLGTTFSSNLLRIQHTSLVPNDPETIQGTPITSTETTDVFAANNAAFMRVQAPFGIEFHRKRWAFGPEFRVGVGGHSVYGGKSYFIAPTTAFTLRLSYFPKR